MFALGVILTELLSGQRASGALPDRVEAMSITELPRGLPAPRSLARRLRGDLEAIIACATDAQPSTRYGSVSALASDVRNVLDCLPIALRRHQLGYRVGKFVRRYLSLVVITSSLLLGLSLSLGLAAWQAIEARRATVLAEANARRASTMRDFVFEVLAETEPGSARSAPASVVDAVERAIERLPTQAIDARARIELMTRFAETLGRHGDPSRALALLESTRADAIRHISEADPLSHVIDERLAFYETDIGQYGRALARIDRLLERAAQLDPDLHARVLARSAVLGWRTNDRQRALRDGARVLELAQGDLPAPTKRMLLAAYSSAMLGIGDIKAAVQALEQQVAAAIAAHGPVHKEVAAAHAGLSRAYRRLGDLDRAEAAIRNALAIDGKVFPEELPFVANHYNALAMVQVARRDFAGELASAERQYAINLKHLGADHTDSIIAHYSIGMALVHQERFREALPILAAARDSYQRNFGADDIRTQHALAAHGFALSMSGDYAGGQAEMASAIARLTAVPHQSNDFLARSLENRLRAALFASDLAGAEDALRQLDAAIPRLPSEEAARWPMRRQVLAAGLAWAAGRPKLVLANIAAVQTAAGTQSASDPALAVEAWLLAGLANLALDDRERAHAEWRRATPMLTALRFPPARLTQLDNRLRAAFAAKAAR